MKPGAENRKKTILAGVLGTVALICVYIMYSTLFGGTNTPAPTPATAPAPRVQEAPRVTTQPNPAATEAAATQLGAVPGVPAVKLTTTAASLDPTLDEAAMLRTESLVYGGSGRNIFSATYTPLLVLPTNVPSARVKKSRVGPPPPPPPPPPPATCPPSCPPINLKFFGTARHANGRMDGFFLAGEDVYLASEGDIVSRKYKIVSISANSARVEDLQNNNTQSLPLQMQ